MLNKLPYALSLIPTLAACSCEETSREDVGEEVIEVFEAVGDPDENVGEEIGEAADAAKDRGNDEIDELQDKAE